MCKKVPFSSEGGVRRGELDYDKQSVDYIAQCKDARVKPGCLIAGCSNKDGDYTAAGLNCEQLYGYNGWRTSHRELDGMTHAQCILKKPDSWRAEFHDKDFEIRSHKYFLSAVGSGSTTTEWRAMYVPPRHGVGRHLRVANQLLWNGIFNAADTAVPFHPPCFEVYKQVSMMKKGKVDMGCIVTLPNVSTYRCPRLPIADFYERNLRLNLSRSISLRMDLALRIPLKSLNTFMFA